MDVWCQLLLLCNMKRCIHFKVSTNTFWCHCMLNWAVIELLNNYWTLTYHANMSDLFNFRGLTIKIKGNVIILSFYELILHSENCRNNKKKIYAFIYILYILYVCMHIYFLHIFTAFVESFNAVNTGFDLWTNMNIFLRIVRLSLKQTQQKWPPELHKHFQKIHWLLSRKTCLFVICGKLCLQPKITKWSGNVCMSFPWNILVIITVISTQMLSLKQ